MEQWLPIQEVLEPALMPKVLPSTEQPAPGPSPLRPIANLM